MIRQAFHLFRKKNNLVYNFLNDGIDPNNSPFDGGVNPNNSPLEGGKGGVNSVCIPKKLLRSESNTPLAPLKGGIRGCLEGGISGCLEEGIREYLKEELQGV